MLETNEDTQKNKEIFLSFLTGMHTQWKYHVLKPDEFIPTVKYHLQLWPLFRMAN